MKIQIATISLILGMLGTGYACSTHAKEATPLSWEEQREIYAFPAWYTEARFGIWCHWGAQTQPAEGGGWYARHMYQEDVGKQTWGSKAYAYHNKIYGHPSKKGFKDVIHEWKAENLDADALMEYFKWMGAKYFIILANHHDHFDNFDSTHHPWNSVNVGPKRDLVKEFEKAAKKQDIPFGVSSHDDRVLKWWLTAFESDQSGPRKGIPYDGYMTQEDGKGTWWEGLDPADLYGLPPEQRTSDYEDRVGKNYMLRHQELVTKYDVDYLWFDGYGFPYEKYGQEVCRTLFNKSLKEDGKINAVVAGKFQGKETSTVRDIERGSANEIIHVPWQGIITFGGWFYKADKPSRHNARTVIESLIDMNSKNGNLVLNIELLPDGTIPPDHKPILDEVGQWINLHADIIYASKPWKIYGDNLDSHLKKPEDGNIGEADLDAAEKNKKAEHFNERTVDSPPYGPEEVRFTTKGSRLFVHVLAPAAGTIKIPSLGLGSEQKPGSIQSIRMIGSHQSIEFNQKAGSLELTVPKERPSDLTIVFELEF